MKYETLVRLTKVLLWLFIAVFSYCAMANIMPDNKLIVESVESIEHSEKTVANFAAAAIGTSVAITILPDDIATPVADAIAGMSKYFVMIMAVLYIEKLVVVYGIGMSFLWLIPIACCIGIVAQVIKKEILTDIAVKLSLLAIAIVCVVPFSTHIADYICADRMKYIEQNIEASKESTDIIKEKMQKSEGNENVFDRLTGLLSTAVNNVNDLLKFFEEQIAKYTNMIAILIVQTCVIPVLTALFLGWIIKVLFNVNALNPVGRSIDQLVKQMKNRAKED